MAKEWAPFQFVVATQERPQYDAADLGFIRAHSARMQHKARRQQRRAGGKAGKASCHLCHRNRQPLDTVEWNFCDPCRIQMRHLSSKIQSPSRRSGNSDPFGATAIPITPETNEMISFLRDSIYPNLQFNRFFQRFASGLDMDQTVNAATICITSFPANIHWKFMISALENKASALANLSTMASYMAMVKPQYTTYSIELRLESSRLLREMLSGQVDDTGTVVTTLFFLFNAEARAGNYEAARTLAGLLAPLLVKGIESASIPLSTVMEYRIIEDDVAIHNLSAVYLDMHDWFPGLLEVFWLHCKTFLPPFPSSIPDVNLAIEGHLRIIFHNLRWIYYYYDHPGCLHDKTHQQSLFQWCVSRYSWLSGCLFNTYAQADQPCECHLTKLQALLSLTAVCHTRMVGSSVSIGSTNCRGISQAAITRIKELIELLNGANLKDRRIAEGLLWVSYIGTLWEAERVTKADETWFKLRFLLLAKSQGISNWHDCCAILRTFLFLESHGPEMSPYFSACEQETVSVLGG